jgi:hypothetical protein
MDAEPELREYLDEIRERVCTRCIERPPGGPPCAPLGKECAVELKLPAFIDVVHQVDSPYILPYLEQLHDQVCTRCTMQGEQGCPCPLNYLFVLVVQAIEAVDERRGQTRYSAPELTA